MAGEDKKKNSRRIRQEQKMEEEWMKKKKKKVVRGGNDEDTDQRGRRDFDEKECVQGIEGSNWKMIIELPMKIFRV